MQMTAARNAAVRELAASVETYVANLVKDFMQSHKDFADPSAASSIQFVQSVSKSVTEATVREAQQIEGWKDPDTGTQWVLLEMPIKAIHQHMVDVANRAARKKESAAFGEKTDEALGALKTELKKKEE
jgi:hypothetical protein